MINVLKNAPEILWCISDVHRVGSMAVDAKCSIAFFIGFCTPVVLCMHALAHPQGGKAEKWLNMVAQHTGDSCPSPSFLFWLILSLSPPSTMVI